MLALHRKRRGRTMNLLPATSTLASETDWLIGSLLLVSLLVLGLVLGLMAIYVVRYRHGSGLDRGDVAQKTWRIEVAWTAATLVAFFGLFIWGANLFVRIYQPHANAADHQRHRQAVDVEGRVPWRPARDQRAAHTGRPRCTIAAHQRGRDPRFRLAGLPPQTGRAAGPLRGAVAARGPARQLPPVLRPVLRHGPFIHGRHGDRHVRPGLPGLAGAERRQRRLGRRGACPVHPQRLQRLPSGRAVGRRRHWCARHR